MATIPDDFIKRVTENTVTGLVLMRLQRDKLRDLMGSKALDEWERACVVTDDLRIKVVTEVMEQVEANTFEL
jgi:hypothetical protein